MSQTFEVRGLAWREIREIEWTVSAESRKEALAEVEADLKKQGFLGGEISVRRLRKRKTLPDETARNPKPDTDWFPEPMNPSP